MFLSTLESVEVGLVLKGSLAEAESFLSDLVDLPRVRQPKVAQVHERVRKAEVWLDMFRDVKVPYCTDDLTTLFLLGLAATVNAAMLCEASLWKGCCVKHVSMFSHP